MTDFWINKNISNYILTNLFDIDEIIRSFGGCPDDEDYKIKRIYYYIEFGGADGYELINVSKDEYNLSIEIGDENYRTDLNYDDFLDKFWFEEFQHFLIDTILPDIMFRFLEAADTEVLRSEHTAKSQIIFQNILTGLINTYENLSYIAPHIKKNKIQDFVIDEFKLSYSLAIKLFIQKYEVIFPKIIERIKGTSKYFKALSSTEKELEEPSLKNTLLITEKIKSKSNHTSNYDYIFKDNGFIVWEYLKEKFDINASSRTDVKFAFEEMKKDGFIHNTVNQTSFLTWINETYELEIAKTSNHSRTKHRLERYQEALDIVKSS